MPHTMPDNERYSRPADIAHDRQTVHACVTYAQLQDTYPDMPDFSDWIQFMDSEDPATQCNLRTRLACIALYTEVQADAPHAMLDACQPVVPLTPTVRARVLAYMRRLDS